MDYFFVSVVGFSLGVLTRSLFVFSWPTLVFFLILAGLIFSGWLVNKNKRHVVMSIFILAAVLGAGRVMLAPDGLPSAFGPLVGTNVSLEGVVIADPDIRETNQHIVVKVTKEGTSTIILAFAPLYPTFSYGETVTVSGTLQKPEPFDTDGGRVFRYDQYLAKDHIFAIIPRAYIESIAPPHGFVVRSFDFLYGLKHTLAHGIEAALPEPSAALAEGLLTGGKQGLGKSLIDAFTVAGLLQIVVLSGYNVMIIAEAVMRAFSFLPKRFAVSFAGISIFGFITAAGSGSSAIRAGIMACLGLFARSTNRTYSALRALGFALVLMLLWNPLYLAFDPGFQFSFAATIGLIIGTPMVEPRLTRIKSAFLRDIIATTIAAQVFVLPLLLWQTGNLSLVALPANILVMPFIPLAMALSFIAGLVGVMVPIAAPIFGIPAYLVLSLVISIATYSAKLPFAHIILPTFPFAVVVLAYSALVFFTQRLSRTVVPAQTSSHC